MNSDRKLAAAAGGLFILGFAGVVPAVLTKPILDAPDRLSRISANENPIIISALFQFVMAAACAGVGISLYPVLKKYHEGLALGAAGFRIIEAVFQIIGMVILLVLVTVSREFVKAGVSESSYFRAAGVVLQAGNVWVNHVAAALAWCLSAFMYYYLFYRTRLVPRWLSGWGLVGITLTGMEILLVLFGRIGPFSTIQIVCNLPIALQEMVLAAWLIIKGFDPSTTAFDPGSPGRMKQTITM